MNRMTIKRCITIALIVLVVFPLSGCLYSEAGYKPSDDDLCLYDTDVLMREVTGRGLTDWPSLLEEAMGNKEAMELLFAFANEIGYYNSAVFGEEFYNTRTRVVHRTDSECFNTVPLEYMCSTPRWFYRDYDWVEENCTRCHICCGE